MDTVPSVALATATSAYPSPLKSATATACGPVPTCALDGCRKTDTVGFVPMPDKPALFGPPALLLVMVIEPVRDPNCAGVKAVSMVQFAPALRKPLRRPRARAGRRRPRRTR